MRCFTIILLLVFVAFPAAAQERELRECGVPLSTDLSTRPAYNYCDIYARQIAYQRNRTDFRAKMDQRRVYNNIPRKQALENYHAWEDARYEVEAETDDGTAYGSSGKAGPTSIINKSIDDMTEAELSDMLHGELK